MHLRGVCGDSLDSMQGPNYQVTSVLEVINHAKNSWLPFNANKFSMVSKVIRVVVVDIIIKEEGQKAENWWKVCPCHKNLWSWESVEVVRL